MVARFSGSSRENPTIEPRQGNGRSVVVPAPRRRRSDEDAITRLASRQHGVVARRQLLAAGVPGHVITHRLGGGRLRAVHRGVYRVGPVGGPRWREMAAVLACGEHAVISHASAGAAWGLIHRAPAVLEVTISQGCRARPGVRVHRTVDLPDTERTILDGVPITTPGRTLLDLAMVGEERILERALARAERHGLASLNEVAGLLERHPKRPGVRALRAILHRGGGPALTRSEAEDRFLALIRAARLDPPETNVVLRGLEVDFLWRDARLVVEVDGFAHHSSRRAFEEDRRRDALLASAGYRSLRVTWRQITREPEALLAGLAQALARPVGP